MHLPRSGSVVAPIEYEELEEIQALRLGIEGLAARLGAERITTPAVKQMGHQLNIVERLAGEHDLDRYLRAGWAYRELCFRASGRDRLVENVRDLGLRAERYLRVAFSSPRGLPQSGGIPARALGGLQTTRRGSGRGTHTASALMDHGGDGRVLRAADRSADRRRGRRNSNLTSSRRGVSQ